jgi:transcriptional regulator with XRE-family HTH domain
MNAVAKTVASGIRAPSTRTIEIDVINNSRTSTKVNKFFPRIGNMSPKRDTTLSKSIGKNISELRRNKYPQYGGLSKCSDDFGIRVTTWSQWEKGSRIPSESYQRKLADFFSISVAELRGELPVGYVIEKAPADAEAENVRNQLSAILAETHRALANVALEVQAGRLDAEIALRQVAEAFDTIMQAHNKLETGDRRRRSS